MRIDMNRLRADRRLLDERIRTVKRALRTTWVRPMAEEQYELIACKREATELCILRAWLRGKLHLPDAERCREVATARAPAYQALAPAVERTERADPKHELG
jgi:hypothetical protein